MKNLTDIKHRIKSVSDTRQITSAMETISVAKMRKAMLLYENNKEYFEIMRLTINDIAIHTKGIVSRYFEDNKAGGKAIFIVIASDKGLAGGFNHNVLNTAYNKILQYPNSNVFTVGQVANEYFLRKGLTPDIEYMSAAYEPSMKDAIEIANSIKELYSKHMMDEVYIVYTKMITNTNMVPDIIKLLPLSKQDVILKDQPTSMEEDLIHEIEYEPSADEVLESLIPQYLTGVIYGALIQSSASEQSSRRTAMNNATNNATDILDELNIEYNRARQESVTNELAEIITSSMGVK